MVVVCKNMNASDVQKLVPSLALSGCFNQTETSNGTKIRMNNSGKCVQLKGNLFQKKDYQKDSTPNEDNGCIGEKELCNKISKVFLYYARFEFKSGSQLRGDFEVDAVTAPSHVVGENFRNFGNF